MARMAAAAILSYDDRDEDCDEKMDKQRKLRESLLDTKDYLGLYGWPPGHLKDPLRGFTGQN